MLPIAGVGRGYHLREGSQVGHRHNRGPPNYDRLQRDHPSRIDWVFLRRRWHAWSMCYRSCTVPLRRPVWSRTELSATGGQHKRGVPCPSARAPATLCTGCRLQVHGGIRQRQPRICAYRGQWQRAHDHRGERADLRRRQRRLLAPGKAHSGRAAIGPGDGTRAGAYDASRSQCRACSRHDSNSILLLILILP
jgi:hypothetical protein